MKARLKSKGWGPFKYEWYSVCSKHYYHNETCHMCRTGSWINCWKHKIESWIYEYNPDLWRWWVNGRQWKRPPIFK